MKFIHGACVKSNTIHFSFSISWNEKTTHYFFSYWDWDSVEKVKVTQSSPTLCDPVDHNLPGSSVHGDFSGKNTGVGCHALLQGIFLTQGSNLGLLWLLHYKWILYHWAAGKAQDQAIPLLDIYPVQSSHSVTSDSLWPHGLQHTRPPCPSPTPRVYPNSCPLSQWCHPTISSSVIPFSSFNLSSAFNLSQHQGLFKWVSSSHQLAKVLEFQLQHQSFQWIFRTDFV